MNLTTDKEIRSVLIPLIKEGLNEPAIIFEEYALRGRGSSIADVVVSTPTRLTIYEIKSSKDTTKRLVQQLTDYSRVATEVWVVLDKKFGTELKELEAFPNVGIMQVDNGLRVLKEATVRPNKACLDLVYAKVMNQSYKSLGVKSKCPKDLIRVLTPEQAQELLYADHIERVASGWKIQDHKLPDVEGALRGYYMGISLRTMKHLLGYLHASELRDSFGVEGSRKSELIEAVVARGLNNKESSAEMRKEVLTEIHTVLKTRPPKAHLVSF